ncbi:outer membrane beta-barrel protein [Alsobacter sp. KACC 23698]|uniref:Outer membrane beta-barrel protein n=1 Tax=Alsobacter sp. KACC 23698 TaxID=3149229 RepID=A0AAU7JMQ8_9HYPH
MLGLDTGYNQNGVVGGVHAGYNFEVEQGVVSGVEVDFEKSGLKGALSLADNAAPGYVAKASTEIDWQGSVRGRIGFAYKNALIYGTAGVAYASLQNSYGVALPPSNVFGVAAGVYSEAASHRTWGWILGAGVEYLITPQWTGRVEYRFTKFEDYKNVSSILYSGGSAEQRPELHTVRLGTSYKF